MSNMVYRHGDSKKWKGVGYDFEIVGDDDLQEYLDAGWFEHPDDLLKNPEEPEKKERKKPGPKPKAAPDESHD
ncbi:hypothetical protein RN333_08615 [Enterobacter kobei]|uniref:hypothetical protein n=1 Tax=Enterobacter kobei TaxID=208224 RepID=UPI0028D208DB|nr:hypothetical protein [Enterobacter kobei]WNP36243.1 hypothetical protein RN333_08615 [Enterobacter kobei]